MRKRYPSIIIALALVLATAGCESPVARDARLTPVSRDTPSAPGGNGDGAASARTDTIPITRMGTVRHLPEAGFTEIYDGMILQSAYIPHLSAGREFRRVILKTFIPRYIDPLKRAALVLAIVQLPNLPMANPQGVHHVYFYTADLLIDTIDYNRPGSYIGSVRINGGSGGDSAVRVDITEAVRAHQGQMLGLRIQLAADPNYNGTEALQTYFRCDGIETTFAK